MGIQKAAVKRDLLRGLLQDAVARHEALRADLYRIEGGCKSLGVLKEGIERDVFAKLRKDIEAGKIDTEAAKHVDSYVKTCVNFAAHLHVELGAKRPIQEGRVLEAAETVKRLTAAVRREEEVVAALEQDLREEAQERYGEGHPGPSLKVRRRGEEGEEESASEAEEPETDGEDS